MIEIDKLNTTDEILKSQVSYWNEATFNIGKGKKLSQLTKEEYGILISWLGTWITSETNVIGPFACNDNEGIKETIEQLGKKTNIDVSEQDECEQLIKYAWEIYKATANIKSIRDIKKINTEEMISLKLLKNN